MYVGMIGAAVVLVRGTASAAAAQQSAMLVGLGVVAHDALAVCVVVVLWWLLRPWMVLWSSSVGPVRASSF